MGINSFLKASIGRRVGFAFLAVILIVVVAGMLILASQRSLANLKGEMADRAHDALTLENLANLGTGIGS
jgi:hypothetical protein